MKRKRITKGKGHIPGEAHAKALALADEVIGGRQMTAVEVAAFARLVRVALVGAA